MGSMRTIVAAYDEHESAGRTLERAAELAQALGAHLVVLSAAPPLEQPPSIETLEPSFGGTPVSAARLADNPLALTPGPDIAREPVDRSHEHAERARDLAARAGIEAEIIENTAHDPADALVALAAERDADLLVVGAHRPRLWQRLVGETVEQELSRRARCDLVIVR
jgi:nucleotide-binding universal stress UspA family protein